MTASEPQAVEPGLPASPRTDAGRWLVVRVGAEAFGLPVSGVQEIVGVAGISKVDGAPFPVRGSVNLRGRPVAVVDLGLRLDLGAREVIDSRLVVVRSKGRRIGLLVDGVERLVSLDPAAVEPLPDAVRTPASSCLRGVLREPSGLVLLLDLERTLVIDQQSSRRKG